MFFSVEEWALTGSAQYVEALSAAERGKIALNVNLDSVAGSPNLAALTQRLCAASSRSCWASPRPTGSDVRTVRPLMTNSDHANFAQAGIPALRLVAGFDDPAAHLRVVLTPADTRDKVGAGRTAHRHAVHRRPGCRRLQCRSRRSREVAQPLGVDEAARQARS